MNVFKKFIIPIVVFTLPFLLYFNFVAYDYNQDSNTIDIGFFKMYLGYFPKDDIEEFNVRVGEVRNIGFHTDDLIKHVEDYDFSGNVWSDFQQIGEMLKDFFIFFGNFFKTIWNYIAWFFKVLYTALFIVFDTIGWVLSMPKFIILYAG